MPKSKRNPREPPTIASVPSSWLSLTWSARLLIDLHDVVTARAIDPQDLTAVRKIWQERQAHFASELRVVEAAIKTQETWIEAQRDRLTKLRQERDQLRDLTVQLREPKLKRKGKP